MPRLNTFSFHVRLPVTLKEQLDAATRETGNSLNREIVARIERSFDAEDAQDDAQIVANSLRPVIETLDEQQRSDLIEHLLGLFRVLSPRRKVKRKS